MPEEEKEEEISVASNTTGEKVDRHLSSFLGGTPYDGLYVEAPPERGIFFRPQVYERIGISLVEVYKSVGKSVNWVCVGVTDEFYGFIKSRKRSIFVIDSYYSG